MKKVLAVLMLVGCGRQETPVDTSLAAPPSKAAVQSVVGTLAQSIVSGDVAAFKALCAPEMLIGFDDVAAFMESQRAGLKSMYGDELPVVTDVQRESATTVSVGTMLPGQFAGPSPKRLRFRQENGKLLWLGARSTPKPMVLPMGAKVDPNAVVDGVMLDEGKAGVARQANVTGSHSPVNFDTWNHANIPHGLETTYLTFWPFVPACGTGEVCSGVPTCVVSGAFFFPEVADFGNLAANWGGWAQMPAHSGNNTWSTANLLPTASFPAYPTTCGNGTTTAHTPTPHICCGINQFGWDMWFNPGDGATVPVTCGALVTCPP